MSSEFDMHNENNSSNAETAQESAPAQGSARTVSTQAPTHGAFDIRELVLYAVLLAAGIILNFFVAKPISAATAGLISPEFMISSFCLTILVVKPNLGKAAIIGLIAGLVIQITASVKGPDIVAETVAAMVMALFVKYGMESSARGIIPALGALVTTVVSGCIYALIVPVLTGADFSIFFVMFPVVAMTGVFNAILVGALYIPIKKALKVD